MKKNILKIVSIVLLLQASSIFGICLNAQAKASIEWKETSVDFGETPINQTLTFEFVFKNPGMLPLLITDVKPSCGCTVADFPKHPIAFGAEEKILVTYDAKQSGFYSKTISVYSNSEEGVSLLYIKGEIKSQK